MHNEDLIKYPDDASRCILHLFEDQKVVERVLESFEAAFPEIHQIGIVVLNSAEQKRYIKNKERFVFIDHTQLGVLAEQIREDRISLVFIHFLTEYKASALFEIPKGVKVCWVIYGGDLYNHYLSYLGYDVFYYKPTGVKNIKYYCKQFLKPVIRFQKKTKLSRILKRIDFVSAIDTDVSVLHSFYPHISIQNHEVYAYPLEDTIGSLLNCAFENDGSIMVGNSASYSNNHLYVLPFLERTASTNHKVFLQLAYGGDLDYCRKVKDEYSARIKSHISFMEDFLPLEDYNSFIKKVSFFFFGHWRQEALGNLIMAFYLGGKVFLSRKNPLLAYFRGKGLTVFEIEAVDEYSLFELPEEEKTRNRSIIYSMYNRTKTLEALRRGVGPELNR